MSTRANVIIRDDMTTLYFYRHSDGYPKHCCVDLAEFVKLYETKLRNNAMQSAGHLITRGAAEYSAESCLGMEWKVGAYEPTDRLHGDAEFIYIIDLESNTLETRVPTKAFWGKPTLKNTKKIASISFKTERT